MCPVVYPVLAIRTILNSWLGDHDFPMVWATFTLAVFSFLCCRELIYPGNSRFRSKVNLSTNCVSFYPSLACPQQMSLFLKASKTDAFCQEHTLATACSTSLVCAVTAMHDYFLTARTCRPLIIFNQVACSPGQQLLTFAGMQLVTPAYLSRPLKGTVLVTVPLLAQLPWACQID